MPHKNDRKRHTAKVRARAKKLKRRYMELTQDDSIEPGKALAVLKDSDQVEEVKRLASKLARRGVYVRFASLS